MKLQFTPQAFQDSALGSTIGLLHGEGNLARKYLRHGTMLLDSVGNALPVSVEQIQHNLHSIQRQNGLPLTDDADKLSFCVEMETGTGKTYVYIKTIYELYAQYGLSKFIIVVPSLAIREGVKKFFEMTHEHFQTHYNKIPICWFIYNSSRLGDVREFAQSTNIEVMIINIDAFRKKQGNIIYQHIDRMNGSRAIDFISTVNPVVIIDEPQSVDNTPLAKEAIAELHPLFVLRYSATHREKINTVYRLTPVDAYQQGFVKQIVVSSIAALDGFNRPFIRLIDVDNTKGYKAKIELDVKLKSGKLSRSTKTVPVGQDLFITSGEREMYRGWQISDIDCMPGSEKIELSNTEILPRGKAIGDVAEQDIKRGQIRRTIEIHLDKELRLLPKGIKVLSLFFIDQVGRYRKYEGNEPQKGEYARMFEEEYAKLIAYPKYAPILATLPVAGDAGKAHEGYFSVDKKGRLKDTRGDTQDDQDTYALIMRDKERLLSFETPLRFIFSHSALKEGWDNPNVFQVCTLLEQSSALSARQKIGRGLRLCVNQDGERIYDRQINTLHVIATEHFSEFADNLQREIEQETGIKFGTLDIATFIDIDVPLEAAVQLGIEIPVPEVTADKVESFTDAEPTSNARDSLSGMAEEPELPAFIPPVKPEQTVTVKLGHEGASRIIETLVKQKVIDKKGRITTTGRDQIEQGTLTLPEAYQPIANPIIEQIRRANNRIVLRDDSKKVIVRQKKQVFLSPEFKEIWERIRQKTMYRVKMDHDKFVELAAKRLGEMPVIHSARIVQTTARVDMDKSGVTATETHVRAVSIANEDETPRPDLLTILRNELRLRKRTILDILTKCGRISDFLANPERFLEEAVVILRNCKAEMIADGIRYIKLAGEEYSVQEIFDREELEAYLGSTAIPVEHSVYDHVIYDRSDTERRFAAALDADPDVKLFFKLPSNFKIDTPLGGYNPDWAVLIDTPEERRLYFVLETKGSIRRADLRDPEAIKIKCGEEHFETVGGVGYAVAEDWQKYKLLIL